MLSDLSLRYRCTTLDNIIKHLIDYRGKVVILDMWTTWCVSCAYQMMELQKIYDHYEAADVNCDGVINILDMVLVDQHWTG